MLVAAFACTTYSADQQDAGTDASAADAGTEPLDAGEDSATGDGNEGPFKFLSFAPEPCVGTAADCAAWPSSAQGAVYLYTSQETFGGKTQKRTFHVYVPANAPAPTPLLVVLHDGGKTGVRMFYGQDPGSPSDWISLADSRGASTWYPNTANCRHPASYSGPSNGYTNTGNVGGVPCDPLSADATNARRFIVVFPDGLADATTAQLNVGQHWEDGRVPSPGQTMSADETVAYRDDVGFVDHILETLAGSGGSTPTDAPPVPAGVQIDATRMYVAGHQDGGMMTLRLACEANRRPNLSRVAAFAAVGAELPEPLAKGLSGRPRCGLGTMTPYALMLMRGTNIPTPDCPTPGCSSPTVSGDGVMPYGVLGSAHYVATNERGRVMSAADTKVAFQSLFSAFGTLSANGEQIGFYSEVEWNLFGTVAPRIWFYQANGGPADDLASRGDWNPYALVWQFVSSFHKEGAQLLYETPTWVAGKYRL